MQLFHNVAHKPEMQLLYQSIKEDGYTMPVVCYYVRDKDIYVIVDGFHRYRVMMEYPDIRAHAALSQCCS